jgi:phage tail-like protein
MATDSRDGGDGTRASVALATRRGFDTRGIRMLVARNGAGPDGMPPAASARLYMRGNLPAIYQEGDFGLRFVAALEEILDPIVAILDSLPGHISPELAPRDILTMLARWLGVEIDEAWAEDRLRELVRYAATLSRRRGTKKGLELSLQIAFPHLPLRVEESGGVFTATDPAQLPKGEPPGFVVYCDQPLDEPEQASVARAIEAMKPVHVPYRLRVRAPRKAAEAKSE